ncbi:FAD-dependent monooxygenase [Streptomyces sp. NBC_00638]|uniref:FAD-dependent monooxygenase n=1 Tax=Streptomyces sp. NBC_00638 TaxID=2975794 RepID=UPI00224D149B|nr:FAD-dependent monooxygenase [Streptomyces sp. NBC_00638]MCX5002323.1 FAD-dependent monooxygenase [Streptomyces sp. NBC_00638]
MAQAQPAAARAVVVGGGIGGLTAAVALHLRGWRVTVLERSPSLARVGAGISLAPNALRALDVIGAGDAVRELAAWQGDGGMRTPKGRWVSRIDSAALAERFGGPLVVLHRATLIDKLAARLPEGTVRMAVAATLVDPGTRTRPALVRTPDGDLEAELVVGADGIRSAVRRTLFPTHPGPVYSGFTTWRIVTPAPELPFAAHETWGRRRIWGTQPLKDGRIYAYGAALAPAGERAADDERQELLRRFGDWHEPIPALIRAAAPADVLRHDVHHIAEPLPAFHRGRAALLGDAAHAMAPTLGQGGNQAIEDAIVLAHHAEPAGSADLAAYSADRGPRTAAIARKALQVARMNMMDNRAGIALRNTAITALSKAGPALFLRSFDGIADWRPPQRPYASDGTRVGN